MRTIRILLLPASLLLSALAVFAQGQQNGTYHPATPTEIGPYTAIVSGDLDGNLSQEVAVIHGSSLIVFQNPDTSGESVVVAEDAIDVCYLPDTGGDVPGLLYTTPTGLGVATFYNDGLAAGYDCDVDTYWNYPLLGAKKIRYAPDDRGQEKVFFLAADSKSFYSAVIVGGLITGPQFLLMLPWQTAWDFVLLNYADSGNDMGMDLGILHNYGVNIRGQLNTIYLARSAITPGDAIAAVRHPSSWGMKDSLAWITRFADGVPRLLVFNPSLLIQSPSPYQSIMLGGGLYGSAASADVDGDGGEDLVLGRTTSKIDVQKLTNPLDPPNGSFFFDPLITIDMSYPSGGLTPMGKVLCADLFNDHDANDAVIPGFAAMLTDLDWLRIVPGLDARGPGTPQDPPQLPPPLGFDFDGVRYDSALHRTEICNEIPATPPDPDLLALWTIYLGTGWGPIVENYGANYIELIVRRCPGETTAPEVPALAHLIFPIDSVSTAIDGDGIGIQYTQISFHAGAGENEFDWREDLPSRQFAMVRPIRLTQTDPPEFGSMNRAWRWSIIGMSANCEGSYWLRTRTGAGFSSTINMQVCSPFDCTDPVPEGLSSLGNRLPPQAVPQSNIPASEGNVMPIINPPPYNH